MDRSPELRPTADHEDHKGHEDHKEDNFVFVIFVTSVLKTWVRALTQAANTP
jgi:hypothetical protein